MREDLSATEWIALKACARKTRVKRGKLVLGDTDIDVIRAMADNGMKLSGAARNLFMDAGTVRYHVNKIRDKTGLDPRDFHDLVMLYILVIERESTGKGERYGEENKGDSISESA